MRAVSLIVAGLVLTACGTDGAAGRPQSRSAATKSKPAPSFGAREPADQGTGEDSRGDAAGDIPTAVWAHSVDTLYKLDPVTKAVDIVGKMTGCTTDVIDIALDSDSNMFATTDEGAGTRGGLFKVDRATGACTRIAEGVYPNSLSFVPKGTVDPNEDALVGFEDDTDDSVRNDYVRIDTRTGTITKIGSLGNVPFVSSGDLVSVRGGPTYLTVRGDGCRDCLVEVDPRTGAVTKNWGTIQHEDVFGIGFWGGVVYGFDYAGELFEMTFAADHVVTHDLALALAGQATRLEFGGAGSSTRAPVSSAVK